ncbi:MAG: hypothetical protein HS119_11260 [Flavobacteriales bacterium]|nr:hypothetical protein [Flavobacteriales bacterium]
MKKLNYVLLSVMIILTFSCDKREDFFAESNQEPFLEINALNTPSSYIKDFTSVESITDSFNLVNNDYLINFRITDESKDVKIEYFVDNGATITLVSSSVTTTKDKQEITGVIKAVPNTVGLHNVDIVITDPYNKSKRISIKLNVYLRNAVPILSISTVNNVGSNNQTLVGINITDTFSFQQGTILIDYQIMDDNAAYNFNFNTTNAASINENLGVKIITPQTHSVVVTGQLRLTPTQLGLHVVTITVTDDIGQQTQLFANIYIMDIPAVITVNPALNTFTTTSSYVSSFSEMFLFELGVYKIKYRIVDDNISPNFTFTSNNSGVLTEDLSARTVTTIGGISTIEGLLNLSAVIEAVHTIQLNVAEPGGTVTSTSTVDIRKNKIPTCNVGLLGSDYVGGKYYSVTSTVNSYNSDPAIFNDAIINYDLELYKNGSLVTTHSTNSSVYKFNDVRTIYGTGNYYVKARCNDKYGGISLWVTSTVVTIF